jgi:hypothetical protein
MNIPEIGTGLVLLFMASAGLTTAAFGFRATLFLASEESIVEKAMAVGSAGMTGITLISGCAAGVIGVQAIAHGFSSVDAPVSHPTQSPSGYSVLKQ